MERSVLNLSLEKAQKNRAVGFATVLLSYSAFIFAGLLLQYQTVVVLIGHLTGMWIFLTAVARLTFEVRRDLAVQIQALAVLASALSLVLMIMLLFHGLGILPLG